MHRISSDKDYYATGKIVIDADGIPVELGYRGTGSPEGKVSAPVGAMYTDSAATNGAIRWVKASGTGATGWRVEYGDTGWRDISDSVDTNTLEFNAGGYVRIRRVERYVEYAFKEVKAKKGGNIYLAPVGFRPRDGENANAYQSGFFSVSTAWMGIFGIQANTMVGADREFVLRIVADANWPTSLPGAPV